jgi:hypothetical protein
MIRLRSFTTVAAAVLLAAPATAFAQTCLGNPSFANGHLQLTADVAANADATAFGVGLGGGSESVFGAAQLGGVTYDAIDGSTLLVGGSMGYQVPVSSTGSAMICPVVSGAYGFGPRDFDGLGTDLQTRAFNFGLSLGFDALRTDRMRVVPALSAGFVYAASIFDAMGTSTTQDDTYGVAGFALGLVLNDQLSIRPTVSVPFGLDGAEPSYGIGFTLNYGGRR